MMMTSEDGDHGVRGKVTFADVQGGVSPGKVGEATTPEGAKVDLLGTPGEEFPTLLVNKTPEGDVTIDVLPKSEPAAHRRPRPGAPEEVFAERKLAAAVALEEEQRDNEPYALDDDLVRLSDLEARAYAEVWDHYQCAYNAVQHRNLLGIGVENQVRLMTAIMGRNITIGEDDPPIDRLVWEAGQERARLLARIERVQETLAVQAESVASQQKLIERMTEAAARGKASHDMLMYLGVKAGVSPLPKDPEELGRAIMVALGYEPPAPTSQ